MSQRKRHLFSTLIVIGGFVGFLLFNHFLQSVIANDDKDGKKSVARFQVQKQKPKKVTQIKKPKKKPKKKVAPPKLLAQLSGRSFGLEALENLGGLDAGDLLGDLRDVVMTSDTVDVPPKAKHRPQIEFPESARKKGIQGFVKVGMLINQMGRVENIQVLQSEPQGVFETIAMNSAKNWLFDAAEYKGQKVKVWAATTIRFDMN